MVILRDVILRRFKKIQQVQEDGCFLIFVKSLQTGGWIGMALDSSLSSLRFVVVSSSAPHDAMLRYPLTIRYRVCLSSTANTSGWRLAR